MVPGSIDFIDTPHLVQQFKLMGKKFDPQPGGIELVGAVQNRDRLVCTGYLGYHVELQFLSIDFQTVGCHRVLPANRDIAPELDVLPVG